VEESYDKDEENEGYAERNEVGAKTCARSRARFKVNIAINFSEGWEFLIHFSSIIQLIDNDGGSAII